MPQIENRMTDLIRAAEARWRRSTAERNRVHSEMAKAADGGAPDWRDLDQRARYARRLERLGDLSAAEAVMDDRVHDFNPLERILGASQLAGIEFFERGIIAARAVARIEIRNTGGRLSGYGSGVMVSPRLLMTNNHVLGSETEASGSVAQFEYLTTAGGITLEPRPFRLSPRTFFVTSKKLDFTLVAVEEVNAAGEQIAARGWCPLIPGSGKAVLGERVNIIQHPGGERMQIAVRDNTVVAVVDDFLQYEADTKPGSSGSPVFNEQWEMAALHHAGVPERDPRGRVLMRDGRPWTGRREDIDRINWIANEGVRISRIVRHVESESLDARRRALFQEAFTPPRPLNIWDLFRGMGSESTSTGSTPGGQSPIEAVDEDGNASWLFRLSFGPAGNTAAPRPTITAPSSGAPAAGQPARGTDTAAAEDPEPGTGDGADTGADLGAADDRAGELAQRIFERFQHDGPYYDQAEDSAARDDYWQGFDLSRPADELAPALQAMLEETHTGRHSYARARHEFLYPAIDLHEGGEMRNIYSGTELDPREAIARELAEVLPRAEALGMETAGLDVDALLDSDDLWERVEAETLGEESASAFNCEHVVCQSWFDKRQPMKADIHHLFACEPGCNSFRNNIPYWIFGPEDEAVRDFCGRREGNKFEPEHGHGPAARATMYFLMRYPGEVGDRRSEFTKSRVGVLLKWHEADPPCRYEQHRNWLTEKAQGNRNPFIDFPDIATAALLNLGFGRR